MNGPYSIQNGEYVRTLDGEAQVIGPVVALCFDLDDGVLHGHGKPEDVEGRYKNMVRAYHNSGLGWFAKNLSIWTGTPSIEELNRAVNSSGYMKQFMAKETIV